MASRIELRVEGAYHLERSVGPLVHGRRDPTASREGGLWKATRTPEGPGSIRFSMDDEVLVVEAWGPGADWLIGHARDLSGANDDLSGFDPSLHGRVRDLAKRFAGTRIPRGWPVTELLTSIILFQLVTWMEGLRAWRNACEKWGEPAPGPMPMLLPPDPAVLAKVPYYAWIPLGAIRKQADAIALVCQRRGRMEEAAAMNTEDASRRLQAIRGIGPWTAHSAMVRGMGHADAVVTGDIHLPNTVAWILAREERGDDARMLELLEPWRGHRGRVVGLLMQSGWKAPRRGPKRAPRDLPRG